MQKYLGNTDDLVTLDTRQLGRITAFAEEAEPMAPNVNIEINPENGKIEFPPVLDEGVFELSKKNFVLPYDKSKPDPLDASGMIRGR